MDSPSEEDFPSTYQCVACQWTCHSPNALHRHQSYRHTPEELSLSIMGVHRAAIRTFDLPKGIAYDFSWLYDPSKHAEFYTYSSDMLCDGNDIGLVVDYASKNRPGRETVSAAALDDEDTTDDATLYIDEKFSPTDQTTVESFADAGSFEETSCVGESEILDLCLKAYDDVRDESPMDTERDVFRDCVDGLCEDLRNLRRDVDQKFAASGRSAIETCGKVEHSEEREFSLRDSIASKILDLGKILRSEVQTETPMDEGIGGGAANVGRDVDSKSVAYDCSAIVTCEGVKNVDEQSCVRDSFPSEILDLSRKMYLGSQTDDFGNLRGENAKMKQRSSQQGADKPQLTAERNNGNGDSPKDSQDSLSWFESEELKIKRYNNKVKKIRASQQRSLLCTEVASKRGVKEDSAKVKKRPCSGRDAVQPGDDFGSQDTLASFDKKGAYIGATTSEKVKKLKVSRKKVRFSEPDAVKSAEEATKVLKKPFKKKTWITRNLAEPNSILIRGKKSKIATLNLDNADTPRVSRKKARIIKTEAVNSAETAADILKKPHDEDTAEETVITRKRVQQGSIWFGGKISTIDMTTAEQAKKPKMSRKKARTNEAQADTIAEADPDILKKPLKEETDGESLLCFANKKPKFAKISATEAVNADEETTELLKKLLKEEIAGETDINQNCAEHRSLFSSDQSYSNGVSETSKLHASTPGTANEPVLSQKKRKTDETDSNNSPTLRKLLEEETAGKTQTTKNRDNDNGTCAEHRSIFSSTESILRSDSEETKINLTASRNAKKQIASPRKAKNPKTAARKATERGTTLPANENCPKASVPLCNLDFESDDFLISLDEDIPKINATCSETSEAQAEKTTADKPADRQSVPAGEQPANKNGAKEAVPRSRWDFKSQDFLAFSDEDGPNISSMRSGNVGTRTEETAVKVTAELLRDIMAEKEETPQETESLPNQDYVYGDCVGQVSTFDSQESAYHFESEEAKISKVYPGNTKKSCVALKKSTEVKVVAAKRAKRKGSRNSGHDVYTYIDSEQVTIIPLHKYRSERSRAFGRSPKTINAGNENCAEHDSSCAPRSHSSANRPTTDVEKGLPSARKSKKRQTMRKKSTRSKTVSAKPTSEETARETTRHFYQEFGSEVLSSQNSDSVVDLASSTEDEDAGETSENLTAGNFGKHVAAKNKPNNVKTPENESAVLIYKGFSVNPGSSSACDNELSTVTFAAYPPGIDDNSILVFNPKFRELEWQTLQTGDSQPDEILTFRGFDREYCRRLPDAGNSTASRNVDYEKLGSAMSEELASRKNHVGRRSTRIKAIVKRYTS